MSQLTKVKKDVDIVGTLLDRARYTPDYSKLRRYENLAVFVYNDLMGDLAHSSVLSGAQYLGVGRTATGEFLMRNKSDPVVFRPDKGSKYKGHVVGEVFAIKPQVIFELDHYHMNTIKFYREEIPIFLKDQSYATSKGTKNPSLRCLMYLGVKSHWDHIPDFGGAMPLKTLGKGDNRMVFKHVGTPLLNQEKEEKPEWDFPDWKNELDKQSNLWSPYGYHNGFAGLLDDDEWENGYGMPN